MAKTGKIANGGWYCGCRDNLMHLKAFQFDFTEKLTEEKFLCKQRRLPCGMTSGKSGSGVGDVWEAMGEFHK